MNKVITIGIDYRLPEGVSAGPLFEDSLLHTAREAADTVLTEQPEQGNVSVHILVRVTSCE